MNKWVVYVLECKDKTLYTGITNNLRQRLLKHESGQGAKYTRGRGPFRIFYSEPCENRTTALKREYSIKKMNRANKLMLGLTEDALR